MLTYLEVHLYYIIPPTICLFLLFYPILSKYEKNKIFILSLLAVVYTTPWDNYIVYRKAWWYRNDAVIAVIGFIPFEEYLFFVLQTTLTTLWTSLCTRQNLHALQLRPIERRKKILFYYLPLIIFASLFVWGLIYAIPNTKTFYLGCFLWWSMPVVFLLWFIAGTYVINGIKTFAIAVIVPAIYLCYVDVIALKHDVWHINEATSLEIFPIANLPIEEIIFFFVSNSIVALASSAFDRAQAIIDTFHRQPINVKAKNGFFMQMFLHTQELFVASFSKQTQAHEQIVNDLNVVAETTKKKMKYFSWVLCLFSNDVSQDSFVHFAFCRILNDEFNGEKSKEEKLKLMQIVRKFIDQLFANRRVKGYLIWHTIGSADPKINWKYFAQHLNNEQLAIFRCMSRIIYYLPQELFYNLLEAFQWDIEERTYDNADDVIEYSKLSAARYFSPYLLITCHKLREWPDVFGPKYRKMLDLGETASVVFHCDNVARNLITDSYRGKCRVPIEFMSERERQLLLNRTPNKIVDRRLLDISWDIEQISEKHCTYAFQAIEFLPRSCRRLWNIIVLIYHADAKTATLQPVYKSNISSAIRNKIGIISYSLYINRNKSIAKRIDRLF